MMLKNKIIMSPKELRILRAIGKVGWLGILIASFGLGYIVRLFASELMTILPFKNGVLFFVSGAVLMGISYVAPSWFSIVRIRNEKGAIHLSSPIWIDILRWLGIMILSICAIFIFSFGEPTWISLIASCFGIIIFIGVIFMLVKSIRLDRSDEMIITEEYLSIDEYGSSDKKVIMKKDITSIRVETYYSARLSHYYIVVAFTGSDDMGLVSEYKFEPIDQLNISRKVVVKQLKLKNYSVIE